MIVVDSSALLAIALDQPQADACMAVLENENHAMISAGTLAETLIVAGQRHVIDHTGRLLAGLNLQVVDVTLISAQRMAAAYRRWGKGNHPAALNFGDCFAYELAKQNNCALLYIGNDFAQTDVKSAL